MATIFERYGGFATMRRIVSSFYDRVLSSDLAHHFDGVDMRRLIQHQTEFIAYVTGGPGPGLSDDALLRIHAPLHITAAEFDEMRRLLRETLADSAIAPADVDEIDAALRSRRASVVSEP